MSCFGYIDWKKTKEGIIVKDRMEIWLFEKIASLKAELKYLKQIYHDTYKK